MTHSPAHALRPSRLMLWTEIALTLWLYYLLIAVFIIAPPFVLPHFGYNLNLRQGTAVTFGGVLIAELIAAGLLIWWLKKRRLDLRADLGLKPHLPFIPTATILVFSLLYSAYTFVIPEIRANALEFGLFKLWGTFVGAIGAVVEETVFRGFLLAEMKRHGSSRFAQILVSGVAFGLLHIGFSAWAMLLTLGMGVVFGYCYIASGRNLWVPILGHIIVNIIIEPWLLLYTITRYSQMING